MSVHKEIKLEDEICDRLSNQGWIYEAGSNTKYDTTLALFPEDVSDWVKATQPKAWDTIQSSHGANAQKMLAERVRKALDSQGIMDVLRQGFDMMGLRKPLSMCQFKPALGMNADLQASYAASSVPTFSHQGFVS